MREDELEKRRSVGFRQSVVHLVRSSDELFPLGDYSIRLVVIDQRERAGTDQLRVSPSREELRSAE